MSDPAPRPPLPDALLAPLLEEAGEVLRSLDPDEVPPTLRTLRGFDRRGLAHGPARRQLRRALEGDEAFRELVTARFLEREEVRTLLDGWNLASAAAGANDAADRDDVALLASALWAARPEGHAFGSGALAAVYERRRREWGDAADARATEQRVRELEEALRRAETARRAAEAEAARLEAALTEERRSRRAREEQAEAEAAAARQHAESLEVELERARRAVDDAEARVKREVERVRALDDDLRRLRGELARRQDDAREAAATRSAADERALREAARTARRLADLLGPLAGTQPAEGARPAPARAAPPEPGERPRAPARRTPPPLPAGLVADSVAGLTAMLRAPGVVLVVDGYNVSQRAWHDTTPSDQRTRLALALAQLHPRYGCETTVVFDGDGTEGVRPFRRAGLRVVFSAGGEEADDVVVRVATELPRHVPVVVASSDAWVREHAEAEGAVVVSAETLLGVLRS